MSLPKARRLKRFVRRYSTQLAFASFVLVFLTFSVGEGQAYDPNFFASSISDEQVQAQAAGFIGKPQVFADQTILTGEIQQSVAIPYTVEKGDSLMGIANRYNTTVAQLIETNNLQVSQIEKIKPGTEILIPAASQQDSQSLAWLGELNDIKQKEAEAARAAELKRQQQTRRNNIASNSRSRSTASISLGNYVIVGTYRNLPSNGAYPGQCTQWVLYKTGLSGQWGNGGQYLSSARAKGYSTGMTPRVGAIAVFAEGYVGHVGYVESVSGSTFTISEMNFAGKYVVDNRTLSTSYANLRGFAYVNR